MPIRRPIASGSATDVPPNFMTTLMTASPAERDGQPRKRESTKQP
jgi:hypothetical protein